MEKEKEAETESKKIYTLEDIADHNKHNDLFIAVHGKVYDLTSIRYHPGVFRTLLELGGTDASETFDN